MAIRILPFRQYDENDVINLFAFSGTINDNPDSNTSDAGMLVSVDTSNNDFSADPISLAANGDLLGKTNYLGNFTSILQKEWVFATQFHPEKSAEAGLILLENFLKW